MKMKTDPSWPEILPCPVCGAKGFVEDSDEYYVEFKHLKKCWLSTPTPTPGENTPEKAIKAANWRKGTK